mmetsp:Transcript_45678/g.145840  ORF Transcript_45678/g.145840 Transcript_45678/m.145840 type:complete len:233 (-) Transcript_45678:71-769(-)
MLVAILPKKVLSPVAWTRHVALPLRTVVPAKARFRASAAETPSPAREVRGSGSASPVRAEWSTSIPSVQWRMRTSAGTRCPASRKITSPGTRLPGSRLASRRPPAALRRATRTPSLDCIRCTASIMTAACSSACHCSTAVATITSASMIGVTWSAALTASSSWCWPRFARMSATSMATQPQSRALKVPRKVSCSSFSAGLSRRGGLMRFGPKACRCAAARSSRNPAGSSRQR